MKKWNKVLFLLLPLLLTGCTGRELEDRAFPSILTIEWDDYEDVFIEKEKESMKYLDYSHVKAVLFEERFTGDLDALEKMIRAFFEDPEFAKNTLIFLGDEETLELAEEKKDGLGNELQDYYKNHDQQGTGVTLTDLFNFFNNQEEALEIPFVKIQKDGLLPSGSVIIRTEKGNA